MFPAAGFFVLPRPGARPPCPQRSFAMHWAQRCEGSWRRAFLLFGAGIPCCFLNLAVAAWIKFENSIAGASLVTAVMGASLLLMAYFHRKWTRHILATEQEEQVGGAWGGGAGCQAHGKPYSQLQPNGGSMQEGLCP